MRDIVVLEIVLRSCDQSFVVERMAIKESA